MHRRALLSDRDSQHGVRQVVIEQAARQGFCAGGGSALPYPHSHHTGRHQQYVAPFDRSGMRLIGTPDSEEPGVVGID